MVQGNYNIMLKLSVKVKSLEEIAQKKRRQKLTKPISIDAKKFVISATCVHFFPYSVNVFLRKSCSKCFLIQDSSLTSFLLKDLAVVVAFFGILFFASKQANLILKTIHLEWMPFNAC